MEKDCFFFFFLNSSNQYFEVNIKPERLILTSSISEIRFTTIVEICLPSSFPHYSTRLKNPDMPIAERMQLNDHAN